VDAVRGAGIEAAVYESLTDPRGIGVVSLSEDPEYFVTDFRQLMQANAFAACTALPDLTMFGRTYTIGYEADLDEVLIHRPRKRILNPDWPWAVWYPLRRRGEFALLPQERQREILGEHGAIGREFGSADLAYDIRLACHGMDRNDNDFVVGLLGKDFHPLSAVVQRMRGTVQTSTYIERLGPFFVGRVVYQSSVADRLK
jgi:chlorite dismutase